MLAGRHRAEKYLEGLIAADNKKALNTLVIVRMSRRRKVPYYCPLHQGYHPSLFFSPLCK